MTDVVIDEIRIWQSRPLDSSYPVVFWNCLIVKVHQDTRVINRAMALGITGNGHKDLLKFRIAKNEGAKFRLSVLTDMHFRQHDQRNIPTSRKHSVTIGIT